MASPIMALCTWIGTIVGYYFTMKKKIATKQLYSFILLPIIFIGVGIGIIATIVLWKMLGAIATISMSIPILFWNQQASSVNAFNSYRI